MLLFLRVRFAKIAVMLFWTVISAYGLGRILMAGFTWQRGFIALCGPIMIAVYKHYGIGPRDDEEREWREQMGRSLALAREGELSSTPDYSFLPDCFRFAIPFFEEWSIDDDLELNETMSDLSHGEEAELRKWAARLNASGQAGELYDLSVSCDDDTDDQVRGRWNVERALLALDAIGITLTDD